MRPCQIRRLGLVPYREVWELQKRLAAERAADSIPDTLLLLEHPHTYTFGRSGHEENLVWPESQLAERGIAVEWVDRGGDVTYHGPGQLVGYPIMKLGVPTNDDGRIPQADYVGYVRRIEESLIRTVARFGIVAGQIPDFTGAWVQPDAASRCPHCPPSARFAPSKIAAIGVKVDARGISQHGFALNVSPDMSYFDGIIPCGIRDHGVVSMSDLLIDVPAMETVMEKLIVEFGRVFEREMAEKK
ncbi:MAG TPA: lipoyl(octanoyl) transferase LipB [Anaerolineales bacterium]|nr:lipoyl(octanoyl) transferase LipB [Anaerolineales bacterium]